MGVNQKKYYTKKEIKLLELIEDVLQKQEETTTKEILESLETLKQEIQIIKNENEQLREENKKLALEVAKQTQRETQEVINEWLYGDKR